MAAKRDLPMARPQQRELTPEDFDRIREAVMETPRGRWFLDQYAERLRSAETAELGRGMQRLEKALAANHDAVMGRLAEALSHAPPRGEALPLPAQPDLAPLHMKYFRADEDLFEPAPHAQIAAVPVAPPPFQAQGEEPEAPAKRRIVIIRHKPGEQIDVPLADELARAS